ncbi:unnamed protein product [Ixodes hexagonus]
MELLRLFLAGLLLCLRRELATATPVSGPTAQTEPILQHHEPTPVQSVPEAHTGSRPDTHSADHSSAAVSPGSQANELPQQHHADAQGAHETPSKLHPVTQTGTHSSASVPSGSQDQASAHAQAVSPDAQRTQTGAGTSNQQDPNRGNRTRVPDQRQGGYYPNRRPYYPRPGYNRPGYNRPGYHRPGYNRPGYNRPGYHRPGGYPNRYPYRPLVRNYLFQQPPHVLVSQADGILKQNGPNLGFIIDALLRLLSFILSPGGGTGGGSGGGGGGNGSTDSDNMTSTQDGSLFFSVTNSSGPVKLLFALAEVPPGVQTVTDLRLNADGTGYYGLPPGPSPWPPVPPRDEMPEGGGGVDAQPAQPPKYEPGVAARPDQGDGPATFQDHPPDDGYYY